MKRIFAFLIACAILVSTMTGCGPHTHTEAADWTADATSHWKVCTECGETIQSGEHTLDADGHCAACNSDITVFDDSVRVVTCDADGNIIFLERYDNDGNPLSKSWEECLYDENGCLLEEQYYANGELTTEVQYTVIDGESIPVMYSRFVEEGIKMVSTYDIYGNETSVVRYDAEGNLDWRTNSEYAQTRDGEWYEAVYVEISSDGTKNRMEYTEYGDTIADITYDAEGNIVVNNTWDYTYDENGFITSEKTYEDGVLLCENHYKILAGDDGLYSYAETVIDYYEDGGKTVSVYDEFDKMVSVTHYDADGNVIE